MYQQLGVGQQSARNSCSLLELLQATLGLLPVSRIEQIITIWIDMALSAPVAEGASDVMKAVTKIANQCVVSPQ